MSDLTSDEREALKIAEQLIDAGVPIFAAAPNPDHPGEYYLPKQWEKTVPSRVWLEKWRPGWALGAVGGHVADFLDFDPRNGGDQSLKELEIQGQMPRSFGEQSTPSGGTHKIISPTGERKVSPMPGVDLQSGDADGVGRGFVYIAPTVRPSKAPETMGQLRAYRWEVEPDLDYLAEFERGSDDSLEGLLARVHAKRGAAGEVRPRESAPGAASSLFAGIAGQHSGPRAFTMDEAMTFCAPTLGDLERARIGEIEERANVAAATLSHFVPSHWTADYAYTVLLAALSKTAYDPNHPASGWSAEKFRPVLDGRRPTLDNWKAELREAGAPEAAVEMTEDAVDLLLAEMRGLDEIKLQKPPRMLVQGLLTLDSESWLIGAPGSKKSFVVLDQALHIAEGRPWMGLKTTQGLVVMIVAEGSGGLGARVQAWERQNGRALPDQVRVLPRPVQAANFGAWQVLVKACERLKPALVVIDTQARVTVGLEENSAKEMGQYVEAVRAIREATGACVLSVHHTGRAGGDARGSSAIDGAQTTELKVISEAGSLIGKLRSEKQKDLALAPDIDLLFVRHVLGVDEDGQEVSSLALSSDPFQRAEAEVETSSGPRVYVPTFHDKDVWRQAILDAIYLHGPAAGMKKSDLIKRLEADFGRKNLASNGSFTGAYADLTKMVDPEGDLIIGGTADRLTIGSLMTIEGLKERFPETDK